MPTSNPSGSVASYVRVWNAQCSYLAPEVWRYDSFVEKTFWKATDNPHRRDPALTRSAIGGEGKEISSKSTR